MKEYVEKMLKEQEWSLKHIRRQVSIDRYKEQKLAEYKKTPSEDLIQAKLFHDSVPKSGCYNKTVELLKASGAYDDFVRCVNEKVDWSNLFTRMGEMENEAISDAIDSVAREKGVKLEDE